MKIRKPSYFDQFLCIAGLCPDSCCTGWAVDVDDTSAAYYRSLPGPLGDKLRSVLEDTADGTQMTIEAGRCPMLRPDGLCRIHAELGEAALCQVCQTFPRLTHDYGDFIEYGLELSCPEAARLILCAPPAPLAETQAPGGEADYDTEAMAVLLRTREAMLTLLSNASRPIPETLALALLYGYQAQGELDGGKAQPFDPAATLAEAAALAKPGSLPDILDLFRSLELLTPAWEALLKSPAPGPWCPEHLALARYLTQRYWLQAISDYDLYSRTKFIVLSCLLVRHLGGDVYRTAQLFSKEIENDADNLDALLDAAYSHPALRDDKLLGLLHEC